MTSAATMKTPPAINPACLQGSWLTISCPYHLFRMRSYSPEALMVAMASLSFSCSWVFPLATAITRGATGIGSPMIFRPS